MIPSTPERRRDWYIEHLASDAEALAATVEHGRLDAAVPACPGWDLAQLAVHVGGIHRWAAACASGVRAAPSEVDAGIRKDTTALAGWLRDGAGNLISVLGDVDPRAERWNPFPAAQDGAFWSRRQAHETALHRWDAERAMQVETALDVELAADGVDEYVEIAVPRLVARESIEPPESTLHLRVVEGDDVGHGDGWTMSAGRDGYRMERGRGRGADATVTASAPELLLALWGRTDAQQLAIIGDAGVVRDWLAVGGV